MPPLPTGSPRQPLIASFYRDHLMKRPFRLLFTTLLLLLLSSSTPITAQSGCEPPTTGIIYSPDCTTAAYGPIFGIAFPPNPGHTFHWEGPDGFSTDQQSFVPQDTGWYFFSAGLPGCLSPTDSIHIHEFDPPAVQAVSNASTYCPGGAGISLSATANSELLFWRKRSGAGGWQYLSAGPELFAPNTDLSLPVETYLVTANGAYGCEAWDTVYIRRQGLFSANPPIVDCPGDTATLNVTGSGQFHWSTGATGPTIQMPIDSAAYYAVTVTDGNGCSTVSGQQILVYENSYASLQLPEGPICSGDTVTLTASGGTQYFWPDGTTGATYSLAVSQKDTIEVIVQTSPTCQTALSAFIYPIPQPDVQLLADTALCLGDTLDIALTLADSLLFSWSVPVFQDTTLQVSVSPEGCPKTVSQSITVYALPQAYLPSDTLACQGDTLHITPGLSPHTLAQWPDNSNAPAYLHIAEASGHIVVTLQDTLHACTAADSLFVDVRPLPPLPALEFEAGYQSLQASWSPLPDMAYSTSPEGGGSQAAGLWQIGALHPEDTVHFQLLVSDSLGCQLSTDTLLSTWSCQPLSLAILGADSLCLYQGVPAAAYQAAISGSRLPGQLLWQGLSADSTIAFFDVASSGPGTALISAQYHEGPCTATDSLQLYIGRRIAPSLLRCTPGTHHLALSWPSFPGDTLYQITVGDSTFSTAAHLAYLPNLYPGTAYPVSFTAQGKGPCGNTAIEKTCRTQPCPEPTLSLPQIVCPGDTLVLAPGQHLPGSITWRSGDTLLCSHCPTLSFNAAHSQIITATLTEDGSCPERLSYPIGVGEIPDFILPDTVQLCPNELPAITLPSPLSQVLWTYPDGTLQSGHRLSLPTAQLQPGTYQVAARTTSGCRAEKDFTLLPVEECPSLPGSAYRGP